MSTWSEPQPDSRFVAVDGLRIHYKRAGHGPALVLLHGSGSSLQHFDRAAALLSEAFDVIRPDLPAFGLTGPRRDRDYRVSTYAATVAAFVASLEVEHYAVAGNSLGGNIAWNLALDHPERLTGLVLVNATGYPEKEMPAGMRLTRNPLLRPVLRRVMPRGAIERNLRANVGPRSTIVDDAMVTRAHQLMNRPGNRSAFVDLCNTDQSDRSAQIPRITVPTLALRSPGIDGQHFARDIPCAQELTHPHGGHLLPEEEPQWVADAITKFLTPLTDTPTH
ncbi:MULTISPECIES: alpha/beta fold hydrolase [Streptomyces]|uniref:alpha/beta fold hydrolase n=1 Tax=Streptomyces scabiei TaxID=1930 RepID=UPI0004E76B15|nr:MULTISPECIES: alpha/beta hydrolase [Streptomyces]MBP5910686.1 alpha/beta hydrolase [Streptomyces sp. LBUM 1478]MBP5934166.1 alpha/beta hydrolase [Streptomyces sp. LBUM 1479]KFG03771.1 alpha/beta hydrolase [Streptomyces scabiei]MBP5910953.1 alpha/beta hydrolase [Streptomyces sp. LBUM 1486]MDX2532999.1 alpha/beta hydrolase [Streptomyces scabiei]